MPQEDATFRAVFEELQETGLLLVTDQQLPSVAASIAGEPIRGSWWGHSSAREIFAVVSALSEHADVLLTKLLVDKQTFIHRHCWEAFLAVAMAEDPWQVAGLSPAAIELLQIVRSQGSIRTDERAPGRDLQELYGGTASRQLESRLLIHSEQFHTEHGAHARRLESWSEWLKRAGISRPRTTPAEGRRDLELRVSRFATESSRRLLPW